MAAGPVAPSAMGPLFRFCAFRLFCGESVRQKIGTGRRKTCLQFQGIVVGLELKGENFAFSSKELSEDWN